MPRLTSLLLALSLGCVSPVVKYTLPPPTTLPSLSLLPDKPVAYPQPKGATLIADSVVMDPPTAAAVAAELQRLAGLPGLYQEAERGQAAILLKAQYEEAQRQHKRAVLFQKWALPVGVSFFVVGVAAGVAVTSAVK